MKKRLLSIVISVVLASVLLTTALADPTLVTVQRQYIGGYSTLIVSSFYSGYLEKQATYQWISVKDDNTETYYVDETTGYQYDGMHKTWVYDSGNNHTSVYKEVAHQGDGSFTYSELANVRTASTIRLKIGKDPNETRKFQSKGQFIARYGLYRGE